MKNIENKIAEGCGRVAHSNGPVAHSTQRGKKPPGLNRASWNSALRGLGLILFAMLAIPMAALADSFHPTNVVNSAVVILSDPTNSASTNSYTVISTSTTSGVVSTNTQLQYAQTGTAIQTDGYQQIGWYIRGYNATTTASKLTETLIRTHTLTPTLSTAQRDWETAPLITWTVTTPAAVGPFYFYTNLDNYSLGSAMELGISQVTNNSTSASVTNFDSGLGKKIVPVNIGNFQ